MELFLYSCSAKNRDSLSLSLFNTLIQYLYCPILYMFIYIIFVKYLAYLQNISNQQFVSINLNFSLLVKIQYRCSYSHE